MQWTRKNKYFILRSAYGTCNEWTAGDYYYVITDCQKGSGVSNECTDSACSEKNCVDGCSPYCAECEGSCGGQCSDNCSGTCKGTCNVGCSGGNMDVVAGRLGLSEYIYRSEIQDIIDLSYYEARRRRKSASDPTITQYESPVTAAIWNTIRSNLLRAGQGTWYGERSVGDVVDRAGTQEFINNALSAHWEEIPVS